MVFQIRSTLDPDYQSHDCPHLTVVVFQIRPNYQNPDCPVFQISRPCLPCRSVCDQVVCTPSCQADETQQWESPAAVLCDCQGCHWVPWQCLQLGSTLIRHHLSFRWYSILISPGVSPSPQPYRETTRPLPSNHLLWSGREGESQVVYRVFVYMFVVSSTWQRSIN